MSKFISYEKVERVEKEECEGLLNGECYIFEKIDGANAQLYLDEDSGRVAYGSRNRVIGIGDKLLIGDDFRGLGKWVLSHELDLKNFFHRCPSSIVYGEWLVKHSINYDQEFLNSFYAFDIRIGNVFCHWLDSIWHNWLLNVVPLTKVIKNPTIDELKDSLNMPSEFGAPFREGIVIKNYDFINKYGRNPYGKLLNKDFIEVKSRPKVKLDHDNLEFELARLYCTKARTIKICHKVSESKEAEAMPCEFDSRRLEMKDIPRIINTVFYDIITEDMNDILKKFKNPTINFKKFKALVQEESKKYFIEFLQEKA